MSTIITKRQFPNYHKYEMELAGRPLTMEVGKLAELANAAVMVGYGDTRVPVSYTHLDVYKRQRYRWSPHPAAHRWGRSPPPSRRDMGCSREGTRDPDRPPPRHLSLIHIEMCIRDSTYPGPPPGWGTQRE